MRAIDIPTRFPIPFANAAGGGFTRPVPVASQIGIQDGAASLTTGFPPDNFVQVNAGGTPPFGQDFNGLLNQMSAWNRWTAAGGAVPWDSAWSAAAGGYPAGALVAAAVTTDTPLGTYWLSTADNNASNPDAGGANWTLISLLDPPARIVTSSANFTMNLTDSFVGLNRQTSLAQTQITIPALAPERKAFTIEDLAGNFSQFNILLVPPVGHTIAGRTTWTLNEDFQSATVRRYQGSTIWSIRT